MIAALIPRGARLADVGTDHAHLPAFLVREGVISRAIATDLRPGPLERAAETVRRTGLEGAIDLRLGDGLAPIACGEADVVVIAGMGGETIAHILAAAPWTKEVFCILQPMTAHEELRRFLSENGYSIAEEQICREGKLLYIAIVTKVVGNPLMSTGEKEKSFTEAELAAGCQSAEMVSPLRGEYLAALLRKTAHALAGVRRSKERVGEVRLAALKEALTEMKKEWDSWQP